MTNTISKKLIIACLSLVFVFSLASQTLAVYNFATDSGLTATAGKSGYVIEGASKIEDIVGAIIYIILGLVGAIFMGLVIYGGFTWMTARGNEENVKKANNILFAALFGLIITLASYVLTFFLINYFWK